MIRYLSLVYLALFGLTAACSSDSFVGQPNTSDQASNDQQEKSSDGTPKQEGSDEKSGNGDLETGQRTSGSGGAGNGSDGGEDKGDLGEGGDDNKGEGDLGEGGDDKNGDGLDVDDDTKTACDFTGDFVDLEFPQEIEDCNDQGKVWNFYADECTPLDQAQSFDCTWDGVENAAKRIGMPLDFVEKSRENNAKLVGCGERDGGDIFIWQSFVPPQMDKDQKNCTWTGQRQIWIGCGRQFTSQAEANAWMAKDNEDRVRECMEP